MLLKSEYVHCALVRCSFFSPCYGAMVMPTTPRVIVWPLLDNRQNLLNAGGEHICLYSIGRLRISSL